MPSPSSPFWLPRATRSMTDSLAELTQKLREFAAARDWEQFHTPKNLAMALSAEVGELLEVFQWLTPEQADALDGVQTTAAADELADVLIYLTRLADVLKIDLVEAAFAKVERNEERFSVTGGPRRAGDPAAGP